MKPILKGHRSRQRLIALIGLLCAWLTVAQSTPTVMNYQGRLTDNSVNQVAIDTTVNITFTIHDHVTNVSPQWTETWTGVNVNNGIFSVLLGSNGTPIPASVFSASADLWLELTIDTETLSPRQRLGSVGFAFEDEAGNEYNTALNLNGTDLEITDGDGMLSADLSSLQDGTGTDDQVLSLVSNTLSVENGNSVDLSAVGSSPDNLGNHTATANLDMSNNEINRIEFLDIRPLTGAGLRFWSSDDYKISMGTGPEYFYGSVSTWGIKNSMSNDPTRGWTWGVTGLAPIAALNTTGQFQLAGNLKGTDFITSNYGTGLVGVYSSTRYQNVFAMGTAFRLAADGTAPESLYGIAWTHSNVGGESIPGLGHQALFMSNGDTRSAIGDGIWTKYNVTGTSLIGTSSLCIGGDCRTSWTNAGDNLGNHTATTTMNMAGNPITGASFISTLPTDSYDKLRVYSSSNYTIGMKSAQTFGFLNDWAMTFTMNNDADRGFLWRDADDVASDGAMSLTNAGNLTTKGVINSLAGIQVDGQTVIDNNAGWHRSVGNTGWYSQTYGGGWYMTDSTWVRTYNSKSVLTSGQLRAAGNIATSSGRVGIGITSPITDLHIKQTDISAGGVGGARLEHASSTNYWKTYHSGTHFSFSENGTRRGYIAGGTGAYVQTSDRNLKADLRPVMGVLDRVLQLKPFQYRYLRDAEEGPSVPTLGFMAQDVEELFPTMVKQGENGELGLAYSEFGVLAIAAIQEQQKEIDDLKAELEALKALVLNLAK